MPKVAISTTVVELKVDWLIFGTHFVFLQLCKSSMHDYISLQMVTVNHV